MGADGSAAEAKARSGERMIPSAGTQPGRWDRGAMAHRNDRLRVNTPDTDRGSEMDTRRGHDVAPRSREIVVRRVFSLRLLVAIATSTAAWCLTYWFSKMNGAEAPSGWAFAGTFATVWALTLAFVIYMLTADDSKKTVSAAEAARIEVVLLREQLAAVLEAARQGDEIETSEAVAGGGSRFVPSPKASPYFDALLRAEPTLASGDIVRAWKPAGQGNKPWVMESRSGSRWSVYLGGRAKREYTVTRLDDAIPG